MDAATLAPPPRRASPAHGPWYTILYIQVLIAIALGILLGHFFPKTGDPDEAARRRLHRAHQDDDRAGDLLHRRARHRLDERPQEDRPHRPQDAGLFRGGLDLGAGDRAHRRRAGAARRRLQHRSRDPRSEAVAGYAARAKEDSLIGHLLAIIPQDFYFGALARGDLLQMLLISILTGFAVAQMGALGEKISAAIDTAAKMFFGIIGIIVRVGADRRVRRHGLHHRRIRHRLAGQSRRADRDLLSRRACCSCCSCSAPSRASPASRSCASSATSRTSC